MKNSQGKRGGKQGRDIKGGGNTRKKDGKGHGSARGGRKPGGSSNIRKPVKTITKFTAKRRKDVQKEQEKLKIKEMVKSKKEEMFGKEEQGTNDETKNGFGGLKDHLKPEQMSIDLEDEDDDELEKLTYLDLIQEEKNNNADSDSDETPEKTEEEVDAFVDRLLGMDSDEEEKDDAEDVDSEDAEEETIKNENYSKQNEQDESDPMKMLIDDLLNQGDEEPKEERKKPKVHKKSKKKVKEEIKKDIKVDDKVFKKETSTTIEENERLVDSEEDEEFVDSFKVEEDEDIPFETIKKESTPMPLVRIKMEDKKFNKKKKRKSTFNVIALGTRPAHSNRATFYRFLYLKKHQGALKKKHGFSSSFTKSILSGFDTTLHDPKTIEIEKARTMNKTLFVSNPSLFSSARSIEDLFDVFGEVNEVQFGNLVDDKEKELAPIRRNFYKYDTSEFLSTGTAHVVFDESESLKKVLDEKFEDKSPLKQEAEAPIENTQLVSSFDVEHPSGFGSYVKSQLPFTQEYMNERKHDIQHFLFEYDKREQEEEKLIEAIRGKPDADGFVKVIAPKGKRHLPPLQESDLIKMKIENSKRKPSVRQRVARAMPLYKFQKLALKKERFQLLRQKFEEDQHKIQKMKVQKKFKPFKTMAESM